MARVVQAAKYFSYEGLNLASSSPHGLHRQQFLGVPSLHPATTTSHPAPGDRTSRYTLQCTSSPSPAPPLAFPHRISLATAGSWLASRAVAFLTELPSVSMAATWLQPLLFSRRAPSTSACLLLSFHVSRPPARAAQSSALTPPRPFSTSSSCVKN